MKNLKLYEEFFWNKKKKHKEQIDRITNDDSEQASYGPDGEVVVHWVDNDEEEMDQYDGYYVDSPFSTLGDFLNNALKVDLDYEMGDDMDAESYLGDEVDKILKMDISQDDKIDKMVKFITESFEIKFPPYEWTEEKEEELREKLEDMFDFS